MKIAICDDEPVQTKYSVSLVRKWADLKKHPAEIHTFTGAHAFLFAWSEDRSFDVLLLDIQMPGLNGLELAREIRKIDETLVIVFITGFTDYMDEGYEVSALHYLIKPVNEDKLFTCLDRACKRVKNERSTLFIECDGESVRIFQDEIVCIEAFAHYAAVNTIKQQYQIRTGIGELENTLDAALFFRPHRSYIVALRYIQKIGKTDIILDNNMQIPVSRRKYNELNRAFIKYYRGEG